MDHNEQIGLAKVVLWEEAKGKLRALAAVSGQTRSDMPRVPEWTRVSEEVERFIASFEEECLHE